MKTKPIEIETLGLTIYPRGYDTEAVFTKTPSFTAQVLLLKGVNGEARRASIKLLKMQSKAPIYQTSSAIERAERKLIKIIEDEAFFLQDFASEKSLLSRLAPIEEDKTREEAQTLGF